MKIRAVHFVWFSAFLLAALPACSSPPSELPPIEKAGNVSGRALLVGINEYQSDEVVDLQGPTNDVDTMHRVLTTRFGFLDENIVVLKNEEATRAGILSAIERQVSTVRPGEVAVFYYSGHGSQVPDKGGDEDDDLDESLVPHDGRTPGVPDVTDDELFRLFKPLEARSIIVIFDCCNSGSGTRGLAVRALEPDRRRDLYPEEPEAESLSRSVDVVEARHVLLSAARSDQVAIEEDIDGRTQGVFTYAISQALTKLPPDTSLQELMTGHIDQEMERLKIELDIEKLATPQLEAPREFLSRPLFSVSRRGPRLPWVEVALEADGRLKLVGAQSQGATRGDVWAIFPPNEFDFWPGRAWATIEIDELARGDALGTPVDASVDIKEKSRAVPLVGARRERLALRYADKSTRAIFEELLGEDLEDVVRWTEEKEELGFVLEHARDEEGSRCAIQREADGDELAFARFGDAAEIAPVLASFLRRLRVLEAFRALKNRASALELEIREPGVLLADTNSGKEHSIGFQVRTTAPCYLTLVGVDSDGAPSLLLPSEETEHFGAMPNGKIEPGPWTSIPEDIGGTWTLDAPFQFTFFVFATPDLELAKLIREYATPKEDTARSLATLRSELVRRSRASDEQHASGDPDWTVKEITFHVQG